jgi:hypothetical protein
VVQNSAVPLSDVELMPFHSESSDDEKSSRSDSKAKSPKSKPTKPSKSHKGKSGDGSQKVSEGKHESARGFQDKSHDLLSSLNQLVELKAKTEEMKIKRMNAQQANEETQRKLAVAKMVLEMDNVSDEVKAKANDILLWLMD